MNCLSWAGMRKRLRRGLHAESLRASSVASSSGSLCITNVSCFRESVSAEEGVCIESMPLGLGDCLLGARLMDLRLRQVLQDQERGVAIGNEAGRHTPVGPASLARG